MKTAKEILDRIVQDGTGIEITQEEALMSMKEIAELAFDAGELHEHRPSIYPTKEQFINKLFQ